MRMLAAKMIRQSSVQRRRGNELRREAGVSAARGRRRGITSLRRATTRQHPIGIARRPAEQRAIRTHRHSIESSCLGTAWQTLRSRTGCPELGARDRRGDGRGRACATGVVPGGLAVRMVVDSRQGGNQLGGRLDVMVDCPRQSLGWRETAAMAPTLFGARTAAGMMLTGIARRRATWRLEWGQAARSRPRRRRKAKCPPPIGGAKSDQMPEVGPTSACRCRRGERKPARQRSERAGMNQWTSTSEALALSRFH